MEQTTLVWKTCGDDGHWCSFETLKLDSLNVNAVYIVFYVGRPGKVVYVGSSKSKDVGGRLASHRKDKRITSYAERGLKVTWAEAPASEVLRIERYLADTWNPLVGDAHPDVLPLKVNSPF